MLWVLGQHTCRRDVGDASWIVDKTGLAAKQSDRAETKDGHLAKADKTIQHNQSWARYMTRKLYEETTTNTNALSEHTTSILSIGDSGCGCVKGKLATRLGRGTWPEPADGAPGEGPGHTLARGSTKTSRWGTGRRAKECPTTTYDCRGQQMFDWRRCNGTVTEPIDELTTAQSNYLSKATVLAVGEHCASLCNGELMYAVGSDADDRHEEVSDLQLASVGVLHGIINGRHGIRHVLHVMQANCSLEAANRTGI